jgi:hypothetical protein
MNILFMILTFPFTFALSPLITLVSFVDLSYSCNEIVHARINKISNIDAFQCSLDVYVMKYDYNLTLPPIHCTEVKRRPGAVTNANVTLKMNHWYRERGCVKIVMSDEDTRMTMYEESLAWFIMSILETIGLLIIITWNASAERHDFR